MVLNKMSFTPVNGASRPRETAFAPVNGASRCAGRHLPDKTGPRVAREDICSGKRGLAHRGEPFARQNGASRCAGSHLPDKMGPRVARGAICPTKRGLALRGKTFARQNGASQIAGSHLPDKMGPRAPAKCQAPAHLLYFAIRITGLSSSSRLEAISFNGPRSLPSL